MKLKLDENLGNAAKRLLEDAGHDVSTAPAHGLQEALDERLIGECANDGRALVTLDLDFANPMRFRPAEYPGIAVLRLPSRASVQIVTDLLRTLIGALRQERLDGRLWIIEIGRLRIYQHPDE